MQKSKPPQSVDLSGESVHWDLREAMSYGDYLRLQDLLSCQHPLTDKHDETLFIVIHQASELWIKLCLHEITGAIRQIRADELGPAFKMMARVARVQVNLIQSWEILSTMTPAEYADALHRLHAAMRSIDIEAPHVTDRIADAERLVTNRPGRTN